MKRALLYILLLSFVITPVLYGVGVMHVHAQNQAGAVDPKVTAPQPVGCNIGAMFSGNGFGMCFATVVYYGLFSPVAWAFGGVGYLFNYIVQELVFRMGAMTGMLEAVTIAWTVMRDIANVFLVFLILFIGIATIVRATSYNSKQLLYRVVIAALLVNFSLYIAKVVIDVSNIFAAQTYIMILKEGMTDPLTKQTAMPNAAECADSNQVTPVNYDSKCFTVGISGAIENVLKINTIYDSAQANNAVQADKIGWNILYMGLLGTVLLLVLIFIFLAAIVLFVTRFITLVMLMIVSPIAFVSLITGKFSYGKQWWNQLLNNALFAPVYFLLLWVAILVISRMMNVYMPGGGTYSSLALANTSGFTLLIVFVVGAGLLIGALVAAKKLGVAGTNVATKFAGDMTFGGAAWAWRNTGGRHFDRKANDKDLLDDAAGRPVWDENLNGGKGGWKNSISRGAQLKAQMKLKAYQKAAKSSGDLRQNIPKGAKSYFESNVGKLGEGHKGGYAAMKKDYLKREQDFADSLGTDTKRKEELDGDLNGKWVDVKDANGNPVIDPTTGERKKVWKEGVVENIKNKQEAVKETRKDIAAQDKELIKMRASAKVHEETVREAQEELDQASSDEKNTDNPFVDADLAKKRRDAATKLKNARAAQEKNAREISASESNLRTKQQELSAHQAEGRALEEQKRRIEEELPRTNRGFVYAENLEKAAKSNVKILGFDTGLKAPGFMAPGGIVFGTNYEQQAAASAIRKKIKNQTKYKSTIDAFKEMKDQGIISEEAANQAIEAIDNASDSRGGGGPSFGGNQGTGGGAGPSGGASPQPGGGATGSGGGSSTGGSGSGGTGGGPSGGTGGPTPSAQPFRRPTPPNGGPSGQAVRPPFPTPNTRPTSFRQFNASEAIPQNPGTDPRFAGIDTTNPEAIKQARGQVLRDEAEERRTAQAARSTASASAEAATPIAPTEIPTPTPTSRAVPQMPQPVQQQQAQARPAVTEPTPAPRSSVSSPDGVETQPVQQQARQTPSPARSGWSRLNAFSSRRPQQNQTVAQSAPTKPAPTPSTSARPAFDPKVAALTQQHAAPAQATPPSRPAAPVVPPQSQELLRQYNVPKIPVPRDPINRWHAEDEARKVFGTDGPFTDKELGIALQAQAAQQQKDLIDRMPPVSIQAGATGVRGMEAIDYLQRNRSKIFVYDKYGNPKRFDDAFPSWNVANRGEGFGAWGTGYSKGLDGDVVGGKEVTSLIDLIHGDGDYRFHPDIAARFGYTQKPYEPTDKLGLNLPKKST